MITEEQLKKRKQHIGASEIASLFTDEDGDSLDPFKNAYDTWVTKVYDLEPSKSTSAMGRGTRHEKAILEYAAETLGVEIETDPNLMFYICKEHPIFSCTLDGKIKGQDIIIEAKMYRKTSEWGADGSDDVPYHILLQCQQQMLCTGFNKTYVSACLSAFGYEENIYVIERNETIINAIIETGERFWTENVLKRIPPDKSPLPNIDLLKRIHRQPKTLAEVNEEIVQNWFIKRNLRIEAERDEKLEFQKLLNALGDAEGILLSAGEMFTYFKQAKETIDQTKLKNEFPEIYNSVKKEIEFRVARIVRGK